MIPKTRALMAVLLAGSMLVLSAVPAAAIERDQLTCYTVKDEAAVRGRDLVSLDTFADPDLDCEVNVAAKMLCLGSVKNGGDDPNGPSLPRAYVCYNATCERTAATRSFSSPTGFGDHQLALVKAKMVGAPVPLQ